jgi:hypothetical protein
MEHARRNNAIAAEQYGSLKNFEAIMHAVNKMLSMDIVCQYKVPAALCCNDAKSCYNHVIHSVGSLCFQQQGIEEPPIVCMFLTLQNLEHTI